MTLSATVPNDWVAISNSKEVRYDHADKEGIKLLEENETKWFLNFYEDQDKVSSYYYDTTPKISTYLYAICAGPYKVFEDFDSAYPPQRVFVRESLI